VDERLESWKEIAAYLRRSVRTVHRWEKEEGLPVHRHLHKRLGTVYAFKSEIDAWWQTRPQLESQPDTPSEGASRSWRTSAAIAFGVVAVLLAGITWDPRSASAPPVGKAMLAVLPFNNLSASPNQEYFSDGLTEQMITELGSLEPGRLGVIARSTAMHYKGTKKTIREIGEELGVDYVLEGSVRREVDRVRVSAQLIRVRDQTHVWAQSYDRSLMSILALQQDVAEDIAGAVRLKLAPRAARREPNPEAYESYLRGRYFVLRMTQDSVKQGVELLEHAVQLDPGYAPAYAALSQAYAHLAIVAGVPPADAMPRSGAAARKAVELDAGLADGYTALGSYLHDYEWNWREAEGAYQRALELNPSHAEAQHFYAMLQAYMGRFDEAVAATRRARRIDPLSLPLNAGVAVVLYLSRRYDDAIAESKHALEMDPNFPLAYVVLGSAYVEKRMYADAIDVLMKGKNVSGGMPDFEALIGYAYARLGRRAEAATHLDVLRQRARREYVPPFILATVHMGLGERDQALAELERAYDDRSWFVPMLNVNPLFDSLRADPRFAALMRRLNLLS
jgi:TolB-like protein/Tfp pilus assembly protein PilF